MNQTDHEWLAILDNPRRMTPEEIAQDHADREWARDHVQYSEFDLALESHQDAQLARHLGDYPEAN